MRALLLAHHTTKVHFAGESRRVPLRGGALGGGGATFALSDAQSEGACPRRAVCWKEVATLAPEPQRDVKVTPAATLRIQLQAELSVFSTRFLG